MKHYKLVDGTGLFGDEFYCYSSKRECVEKAMEIMAEHGGLEDWERHGPYLWDGTAGRVSCAACDCSKIKG